MFISTIRSFPFQKYLPSFKQTLRPQIDNPLQARRGKKKPKTKTKSPHKHPTFCSKKAIILPIPPDLRCHLLKQDPIGPERTQRRSSRDKIIQIGILDIGLWGGENLPDKLSLLRISSASATKHTPSTRNTPRRQTRSNTSNP